MDLFNELTDKTVGLSTKLAKVTYSGKPLQTPPKLSKELTRDKLEIAFALLTSGASFVELRALTTLTAKAKAILKYFPPDPQLNSDLVSFALVHLVSESLTRQNATEIYRL